MDGAADAALGAWASVRGFFTPATLFLVVNLVIGTIALTSRSRRRAHDHDGDHQEPPFRQAQEHQQQDSRYYDDQRHEEQRYVPAPLARTSSVMDRLRSIGLYRFRSGDFPPEYATPVGTDSRDEPAVDAHHHARSLSEPAREEFRRPAPPSRMNKSTSVARRRAEVPRAPAARVARAFVPEEQEVEDDVLHYMSSSVARKAGQLPPAPAARVVRAFVPEEEEEEEEDVLHYTREDDLTVGNNSFTAQQQQQAPVELQHEESEEEENYYREEYVPPLRPAPLARAPSVLERLRSFGLSRFRSGDLAHEQTAAAVEELERSHAYNRSRSEPAREQSEKGKRQQQESAEARMSKSGSVARSKPAPVRPEAEEGGVDARADDFINTFRKQLQLQRLNSLLNYKEMLNRGA